MIVKHSENLVSLKSYIFLLISALFISCESNVSEGNADLATDNLVKASFVSRTISDSAQLWWARAVADMDGDQVTDVAFIHNNGSGGYLGYLHGTKEDKRWNIVKVASRTVNDKLFASGDLEISDMDGDGDIDLIGVEHPGEWTDANAPARLYWYENPEWTPHEIGAVPSAVKDINLTDLNNDGRIDVAILTFQFQKLTIFEQLADGSFKMAQDIQQRNLHEGMDAADIDGDGDIDIAANGYAFLNPDNDLAAHWTIKAIDSIWYNQSGDWSANGTKTVCRDLDGDGDQEIVISHSERGGYPIAIYSYDPASELWEKEIISDSIPACHTLQVADFNGDGAVDLLAGINWARAVNINHTSRDVYVFYQHNGIWLQDTISERGIYNGQVADFDGDGDVDIFQLTSHEAKTMELLVNQQIP